LIPIDESIGKTRDIGALAFRAPELNNGSKYTWAVDYYSFGILVHYILTGISPKSWFRHHHLDARPPISDATQPFNEILERLWHEEQTQRPTFTQVLAEIAGRRLMLADADVEKVTAYLSELDAVYAAKHSLFPAQVAALRDPARISDEARVIRVSQGLALEVAPIVYRFLCADSTVYFEAFINEPLATIRERLFECLDADVIIRFSQDKKELPDCTTFLDINQRLPIVVTATRQFAVVLPDGTVCRIPFSNWSRVLDVKAGFARANGCPPKHVVVWAVRSGVRWACADANALWMLPSELEVTIDAVPFVVARIDNDHVPISATQTVAEAKRALGLRWIGADGRELADAVRLESVPDGASIVATRPDTVTVVITEDLTVPLSSPTGRVEAQDALRAVGWGLLRVPPAELALPTRAPLEPPGRYDLSIVGRSDVTVSVAGFGREMTFRWPRFVRAGIVLDCVRRQFEVSDLVLSCAGIVLDPNTPLSFYGIGRKETCTLRADIPRGALAIHLSGMGRQYTLETPFGRKIVCPKGDAVRLAGIAARIAPAVGNRPFAFSIDSEQVDMNRDLSQVEGVLEKAVDRTIRLFWTA
jgi:hypothetical protein